MSTGKSVLDGPKDFYGVAVHKGSAVFEQFRIDLRYGFGLLHLRGNLNIETNVLLGRKVLHDREQKSLIKRRPSDGIQ